ncbi:MAG TPA: SelB C-terminal domain-containing protein [Nocardioidaceae bacterium]|nr:SelB C-terminal domain-containing protein [Nocardioidaceae bacterium]
MHVVATAGHVDHGKSTLVRALTGSDPDRLAEEKRRGLSIRLGYCWTSLPGVGDVAFVDVPGHERFLSTTLAGVGPVPAVMFVVAADDPWMPQAAEHLAALDALGVGSGVLVVTRCDLADPSTMVTRARGELARTSLRDLPTLTVSGRTGQGLDELRAALARVLGALPAPDPAADVRLWVDRRFHIRGAGTVVTGTLPAGTIHTGDTLAVDAARVRVRGIESLGRTAPSVSGVARVALDLGGKAPDVLEAGSVLVTPEAFDQVDLVDVRLSGDEPVPQRPVLHIGSSATGVHARPLGERLVRLRLERPLPLRIGDRAILRDPGSRVMWGVHVLDPDPPPLRRRGAAGAQAARLATSTGTLADEVARRGVVRRSRLRRLGARDEGLPAGVLTVGDWLVSAERASELRRRLAELVASRRGDARPGVAVGEALQALRLDDRDLLGALLGADLRLDRGRVVPDQGGDLPPALARALDGIRADLADAPFAAPDGERLSQLGVDARGLAALSRAGHLLRLEPAVVLLPGADDEAAERLRRLPQPFTVSQARQALGSSRRVVLPLLAHLDRTGRTRRGLDDRRSVVDA